MSIILTRAVAKIGSRVRCNNTFQGPIEATITKIYTDQSTGDHLYDVKWDDDSTLIVGPFSFNTTYGLDWEWLSNPPDLFDTKVEAPCEVCQRMNYIYEVEVCYLCGSKINK